MVSKFESHNMTVSKYALQIGPRLDKTCLRVFRQSETQTSPLSYRDQLEN